MSRAVNTKGSRDRGRSVDAVSDPPAAEPTSWKGLAVARSVDPAREAAEERVQRFIDTALELMSSPNGDEFTVQNVVESSGLSLRSFYHHFTGKYELLLAVFEETVRTTAHFLEQEIDTSDDPLDRLRLFITGYYRTCRSGQPPQTEQRLPARTMGQFAHQLLFDHPQEASHAFTPLVSILRQLLDEAAAAAVIQPGLDHEQTAGVILQSIMFNAFATTVTGSTTDAVEGREELVWKLLLHGLAGGG
jgi:AcrR family transcriptional regulator